MSDTVPCPYCEADIYEDAVQCPHCGHYLSDEDSPPSRKPPWVMITVIVCLVLVGMWIGLGRLFW
jgi:hypothetical protein